MPRYFFNVHLDDHVARDPRGVVLPDLATAVKQAWQARAEILDEDELDDGMWLEIVDEDGSVLAKVGG
jgi:hypothetical protein